MRISLFFADYLFSDKVDLELEKLDFDDLFDMPEPAAAPAATPPPPSVAIAAAAVAPRLEELMPEDELGIIIC